MMAPTTLVLRFRKALPNGSITFEAPTEPVYVVGTNQTDDIMKLLVADFALISRLLTAFKPDISATGVPRSTIQASCRHNAQHVLVDALMANTNQQQNPLRQPV
jgi:hypothetical protein